jgi:hypothetical protein
LGGNPMTLGPSGVVLRQRDGWTIGSLARQNWRVAGPRDLNATYFKAIPVHTFKTATTVYVDTESTCDWIREKWVISLNSGIHQVFKIGKIPMQIGLALPYFAQSPVPGQQWGFRVNITPMFPE